MQFKQGVEFLRGSDNIEMTILHRILTFFNFAINKFFGLKVAAEYCDFNYTEILVGADL